jgi:uncharacterized protein with HEPN domain
MIPTSLPRFQGNGPQVVSPVSLNFSDKKTVNVFFDSFSSPPSQIEVRSISSTISEGSSNPASAAKAKAVFQNTKSHGAVNSPRDYYEEERKGNIEIGEERDLVSGEVANHPTATLLKPLQENPLHQKSIAQFGLPIEPNHPYYMKNGKWCENVENLVSPLRNSLDNVERMKKSREILGISEDTSRYDEVEKEHLRKIDEAIDRITNESEKEKFENSVIIDESIIAICESAYRLLTRPILSVFHYLNMPYTLFDQMESFFKLELNKVFPGSEQKVKEALVGELILTHIFLNPLITSMLHFLRNKSQPFNVEALNEDVGKALVSEMINAMREDTIEKTKIKLIKEHPCDKSIVNALAEKAQFLLKSERDRTLEEVKNFQALPAVEFCLKQIFKTCPDLKLKYKELITNFFCLGEGDIDFRRQIHSPSHLEKLVALLAACETFRAVDKSNVTLQQLSTSCSEFSPQKKQIHHLERVIGPLIYFKQCLENILLWPQEYELAYCERAYINSNLSLLMEISQRDAVGISYKYLTITPEERKKAESVLKKNDVTPEEKQEAYRTLLHARIPWKVLQAIGCFYHESESAVEAEVKCNRRLITESMCDLIREIPILLNCLEDLIIFEEKSFCVSPAFDPSKKLTNQSFESIHFLGNRHEMLRSLKKMHECVAEWTNLPLTPNEYVSVKIKYAMLRTIQILGEMSKNLQRTGLWEGDLFWAEFEHLRDLLSHLDRALIGVNLKSLVEGATAYSIELFSAIHTDFQVLEEYFRAEVASLKQPKSWIEHKRELHAKKKGKAQLALKGIEDLSIFLNEKISRKDQAALLQTLDQESASSFRKEIILIKNTFEKKDFDSKTYKEQIKKLPLTSTQQKLLEESIKVVISPDAAKNNFSSVKPRLLLKFFNILDEFEKILKIDSVPELIAEIKTALSQEDGVPLIKNQGEPLFLGFSTKAVFEAKIAAVGLFLEQIKKESEKVKIILAKMTTAETFLKQLAESDEDFLERKRTECQELVTCVEIYQEGAEVKKAGDALIRSLQLSALSADEVKMKVKRLGLTYEGIWKKSYERCMKKQGNLNQEEKEVKGDFNVQKKKTIRHIDAIAEQFMQLASLVLEGSSLVVDDLGNVNFRKLRVNFAKLSKDKILHLAFQYLISSFRSNANNLKLAIESIRPSYSEFIEFQMMQETLEESIKTANSILHVHEVTEPGAEAGNGQLHSINLQVFFSLVNFNMGSIFGGNSYESAFRVDSFDTKLQGIKKILNSSIRQSNLLLEARPLLVGNASKGE